MSDEYYNKFGNKTVTKAQMRKHCQRPGTVDKAGNIVYVTEQAHKNQCDVNMIIAKYDKTGLISHTTRFEAQFGDMRGVDYKTALDKVLAAKNMFDDMPSHVRNRFNNNPEEFLTFFENEANRDEAIKLGLIDRRTEPDEDGIGTKADGTPKHKKEGAEKEE